jgi:hypothetical protein
MRALLEAGMVCGSAMQSPHTSDMRGLAHWRTLKRTQSRAGQFSGCRPKRAEALRSMS